MAFKERTGTNKHALVLFALGALAWFLFDLITKRIMNAHALGERIAGPFCGLIEFRLVHNTGGAWGMFGDMTFVLGLFSLFVCALILVFAFRYRTHLNTVSMISLALVFAGGLGNASDRFVYGYVIDFIQPVFIDFPTFNIADIGITCGVVLFLISFFAGTYKQEHANGDVHDAHDEPEGGR